MCLTVICLLPAVMAMEPPVRELPPGAIGLFDGQSATAWKRFDPGADRSHTEVQGGPGYAPPTWSVRERALIADGRFDAITRHQFANYELDFDFLAPTGSRRGAAMGVYLNGRYEIALDEPAGAIRGVARPAMEMRVRDGRWHSLKVAFSQANTGKPVVSVWLDGTPVQSGIELAAPTGGGFPLVAQPVEENDERGHRTGVARFTSDGGLTARLHWGEQPFTLQARFKTRHALGGTIAAKCPPAGQWAPKARALFIRGGRVTYDIGWVGAISGRTRVDDNQWHDVVLTRRGANVELWVDGKLDARKRDFAAPEVPGHVFKIGAANTNFAFDFRGLIAHLNYHDRGLTPEEAAAASKGDAPAGPPAFVWRAESLPADDTLPPLVWNGVPGVQGPVRLRGAGSGVRFANIWIRPLDTIDHAVAIGGLNRTNFANGQRIYEGLCVNCHGRDGVTPSLPLSRAFGKGELQFGTDPFSLYRTLTHGNGNMAAQTWMTEQERYDVIHFIREEFMKPLNPAYQPVTPRYLANLPRKVAFDPAAGRPRMVRDFGPALASQFERRAESALTIALGENTTVSYDLHTMNLLAAWDGGFLNVDDTQHMKLRGEGVPRPDGKVILGLGNWFWGHDGTLDYPTNNLPPRGPVPAEWMDYHGHYRHGNRVILSYALDGREVLESPAKAAGFAAMVHSLEIGPGPRALTLCVGHSPLFEDNFGGVSALSAAVHDWKARTAVAAGQLAAAGQDVDGKPGEFVAASVIGDTAGMTWETDARHRLVLRVPAGTETRRVEIVRGTGRGEPQLQSFAGLVRHRAAGGPVESLKPLTQGGPAQWVEVLKTRGEPGSDSTAYTLDTLTLPESNPWNAWFRTAALDFLGDGRMALTTHGGDVWIVSGIDRDLGQLRWKRFAAGLYEPFGIRVVNDVVYVTCKDRLVRLRDFNGDDEADFYESFSADTDVSFFFHAFNFDLQTDARGNFYYAKAGQYTDYALPGAIIKVSPDGRTREVYCTGFRTPNGMGMLPDGRPTVSDNQGNWIPASKVMLANRGGFYGYSQTHASPGNWAPDGGRIDSKMVVPPATFDPPLLWLPQDVDNSSGGQLWVDDPRWGPLSGRLLHTSFGKGWMFQLMIQDLGDVAQAAGVRLPLDFMSGIHRARVNPRDGQVYAVGLNGWNGGGRAGLGEGGVQRVRYTGQPANLISDVKVRSDGLQIQFNFAADPDAAKNPTAYEIEQWNYKWSPGYGSAQWSVRNPEKQGRDALPVREVSLSADHRQVVLHLPDLKPVNQMRLQMKLKTAQGGAFREEVYLTINKVPAK